MLLHLPACLAFPTFVQHVSLLQGFLVSRCGGPLAILLSAAADESCGPAVQIRDGQQSPPHRAAVRGKRLTRHVSNVWTSRLIAAVQLSVKRAG